MIFSSAIFLFLFLPLVLLAHALAGRRLRNLVLLLFSLGFYAWGEGGYVLVMLYCIATSWWFGRRIDICHKSSYNSDKDKKRLLWIAVGLNLLPLLYFKYATFLVLNLNALIAFTGFRIPPPEDIILPIGISFFTFQALSYIIDVYRNQTAPQKSVLDLGLYISLFPQLIAGPIVRYRDISRQLRDRSVGLSNFAHGSERFIYGLGKKVLIANPLGEAADIIFYLPPDELSLTAAWLGVICYALQIYFDFSGYSDMAIGLGRLFGFRFLENFNYPYISQNMREFWRRWHISLSNWFRDYVYIPLGGNQAQPHIVARNLLLVFLLCGLWHGASWNFVIWGLLHGFFLVIERGRFGRLLNAAPRPLRHLYVIVVVLVAWVFFRADDLGHSIGYLNPMLNPMRGIELPVILSIRLDLYFYTAALFGLILSAPIYRNFKLSLIERVASHGSGCAATLALLGKQVLLIAILLLAIFEITSGSYNPFIYFRF